MATKTVKTADLTGAALDWSVAKCEGACLAPHVWHLLPSYSTDWAQGGPVIEREFIQFRPTGPAGARWWIACPADTPYWEKTCEGETPLIAAMRCLVASKLGDEVEVPEELL